MTIVMHPAFCYAPPMSLAALWAYAPPDRLSMKRLRKERGWRLWLVPRPFTLVSTPFYLFLLVGALGVPPVVCDSCQGRTWHIPLFVGAIVVLLALDRLDYWLFGETPPARAGLLLLALRVIA